MLCEKTRHFYSSFCLCFAFETLSLTTIVSALSLLSLFLCHSSLALSNSKRCLRTALTKQNQQTTPIFTVFFVNFLLEFFCSASWCRRFHCGCSCTAHANEGKALQLYYKCFTRACSVNIYCTLYICFYLYVCQLECILKCCVCLQCEFYWLATQ